jgi:hypothetical protein
MCFGIVKANVSMRQIKVVDGLLRGWAKLVSEIDFAFAASLTFAGNLNPERTEDSRHPPRHTDSIRARRSRELHRARQIGVRVFVESQTLKHASNGYR